MMPRALFLIRVGGLLALLACLGFWGCCSSALEGDYGRSVTHNLAAQMVNPEAGGVVQVSVGQAPEAAANSYEKYMKSFKKEEKPTLKLTTEK
uniref:Uncharacterized protein n=1 Tax=Desulfobacca acetoxidans TaxID=60893 RepID=A0A7V4G8B3_9BACT